MLNADKREQLRVILHQSPRTFGQPASMWTLKRRAAVCHEQGLSDTTLSCPTCWMPSSAWGSVGNAPNTGLSVLIRPTSKKKRRDRLIQMAVKHPDLVLGFEDEVWWSRAAQPALHAWSDDKPVRLVEKTVPAKDPGGKAVACYGLYVPTAHQMLLRFVQGRPVSGVTCAFLAWLATYFTAQGKRALVLIWDNASGTLARRCGSGSPPTIAKPNVMEVVVSWSVGYRARVPGSIPLSPSGCMGNGPLWNPLACSQCRNSCSASAPTTSAN